MNFLPNVQLKTCQNIYGRYWNNLQQLAKILIGIPIGGHEQFELDANECKKWRNEIETFLILHSNLTFSGSPKGQKHS